MELDTYYEVLKVDGKGASTMDTFDHADEAIAYAKENGGDEVRKVVWSEDAFEFIESEEELVWSVNKA